jgi:hypothetical protein
MTNSKRKFIGRFSPSLTFSNVMASVAMFAALGGSAYAAATIDTDDIKAGAVTNAKLDTTVKSRWAIVHHNGTLVKGRTATDAGKVGNATSLYEVTFKHDVSDCAYQATLTEITGGDNLGFVSTEPSGSDPNGVVVETRDLDGDTAARSFHLQVSC